MCCGDYVRKALFWRVLRKLSDRWRAKIITLRGFVKDYSEVPQCLQKWKIVKTEKTREFSSLSFHFFSRVLCLSPGHVTSVDLSGSRVSARMHFSQNYLWFVKNKTYCAWSTYYIVNIDCEENVEVICRQTHYKCTCSRYSQLNHTLCFSFPLLLKSIRKLPTMPT